jgi:hypothetical protein
MLRLRRRFIAAACLTLVSMISPGKAQAQSGVTVASAPVRLLPDESRTPLATLPPGTSVRVIERQGDWIRISFQDKTYGDRVGYLRAEHLQINSPTKPAAAPSPPASSSEKAANPIAPSTALPSPSAVSRTPTADRALTNATAARQFGNAQLSVPDGQKSKQVDVTVSYGTDTFQLVDKDGGRPIKGFPYTSFVGGEYSYSKSPRWKSGLFISPFLFLSSGKKHWLLLKTTHDYAMLRLDKNNYKLVIAEWEIRTGLKVEAQGENK